MACEKVTYSGISAVVLENVRGELANIDLVLPAANKGELVSSAYGVTAAYEYVPAAETISIQVTNKPFFVPCSYIHKKLEEALERAKQNA